MLSIQLDSSTGVFFGGQKVTGKLIHSLTSKLGYRKLHSISLFCEGLTCVSFRKNYSIRSCSASKEVFKIIVALPTSLPGGSQLGLNKEYTIPFEFDLPSSIPSSFEGINGSTSYVFSARMVRYSTFIYRKKSYIGNSTTETATTVFTVNNVVDLNLNTIAKMPISERRSKNIRRFSSRNGPITANAWISQSGYVPGQMLYFNGTVENFSKKTMKGSVVRLIQRTTYQAKGNRKQTVRVIRNSSHGSFDTSDVWHNVPFLIPSLPPSDQNLSTLIQISYQIEFIIDPGKYASKLTVPLDVIIGNAPIASSSPFAPTTPPNDPVGNRGAASSALVDGDVPPPPCYEDCFYACQTVDSGTNDDSRLAVINSSSDHAR